MIVQKMRPRHFMYITPSLMHARDVNAKHLCKPFRRCGAVMPTTFPAPPLLSSLYLHHAHPRFSINAFVSFGGSPLTPKALTCVPLLNLCKPIATFQPSLCDNTKTYFFPSWSRMLARRTCKPIISPLCVTVSSVPERMLEYTGEAKADVVEKVLWEEHEDGVSERGISQQWVVQASDSLFKNASVSPRL
jgi:hypothetical protein